MLKQKSIKRKYNKLWQLCVATALIFFIFLEHFFEIIHYASE